MRVWWVDIMSERFGCPGTLIMITTACEVNVTPVVLQQGSHSIRRHEQEP
jgi:hypothetical protein